MFGSAASIVNRWWGLRLTVSRRWSRWLGDTLLPPRCCLCGFEGTSPDLDLCCFCHADLPWETAAQPGLLVALRYEPPADALIKRLKYDGVAANARVLGHLLAQAAREQLPQLPKLLIPVPLHDTRLRERGFNQAAAIARYAGRQLGVPHRFNLVRRVRDTPSQTGLDRAARADNVRDAFSISGVRALGWLQRAGHIAIVDDVTTTGSTLAELKGLLLEAGVRRVDLWAVARAP
jgi:ComF family protein